MAARDDHGWWPYLVPFFSFLIVLQFAGGQPWVLPVQVAVPAAAFLWFWRRGAYPELAGYPERPAWAALDFAVGVVGGLLWMAPYVWIEWADPAWWSSVPEWLRHDPEDAFDPEVLGASAVGLTLALRALGYGIVTPFVEELFMRSFLLRYAEVFDTGEDFRDVPIATFGWKSFGIVTLLFSAGHVPWEWPVCVPWFAGTLAYFYWRRSVAALVVVHAGSNLGILATVVAFSGRLADRAGNPIDLWFFV